MIVFKIFGIFRPAQSRECPETVREPRVKRIFILRPRAIHSFSGGGAVADFYFIFVVPDGNTVSIPYLPADAPVAQVFYPVEVGFFKMFRYDFNYTRAYGFRHQFLQGFTFFIKFFIYLNKPLQSYLS